MSLYTPIFPSLRESNSSRKGPPESSLSAAPGRQQNHVDLLRDVHLFLSTQNDVLSPPSRPNTPLFDRRVQKVRDEIRSILNATGGEISSGEWTRVSQTLKLGCVRGRHWSVSDPSPYTPDQDTITNWILPDEESEWIEWEKKREENRRLKGKTNASQPDSQKTSHANLPELTQTYDSARNRRAAGVSASTLRTAREKVRKWQASVTSDGWHDATSASSPSSTRAAVATATAKDKTEKPQRNRTIDFAVVKPVAKSVLGKRKNGSPAIQGRPTPLPSQRSKSATPSRAVNAPETKALIGTDKPDTGRLPKDSSVKDDMPKIADISETPYIPPSFPAHLETSTPLPEPVIVIRAKPSPILPLPALSSTPLPSTTNSRDELQLVAEEFHVHSVSPPIPPQLSYIDTVDPGGRSRALSMSPCGIADGAPVFPSAKRLRTLSQSHSAPSSMNTKPISSKESLDMPPCALNDVEQPILGSPSRHQHETEAVRMTPSVPSVASKSDRALAGASPLDRPEKLPSPTKSVKSYFSAADSDPSEPPIKANLLLESPVSPMLSYAQNPSGFLPQLTSTQVEKGSPTAGRTNYGVFGMGYSSQFDVERHVDRVSELLEKDVDFDGWLRDIRTVEETSKD